MMLWKGVTLKMGNYPDLNRRLVYFVSNATKGNTLINFMGLKVEYRVRAGIAGYHFVF